MYNLREIAEKCNIDTVFKGRILFDECIAPRTTFKVGGNAPVLFEPSDVPSLCSVLSLLKKNDVPFFILGGGSNIVVSDDGFDGAVVTTTALNTCSVEEYPLLNAGKSSEKNSKENPDLYSDETSVIVTAGAGTLMRKLVSFCEKNCISGIEQFSGLPGTAGGAVFMNAGCFGVSVSDVLFSAEYICLSDGSDFSVQNYNFCASDWAYKKSPFSCGGKIITSARFKLKKNPETERSVLEKKCASFMQQRIEKGHFKYPCAGSVFKNNHAFGSPSGKIIEELGLKGYEMGGAQVAPWHGNIIINKNHATQADIKRLAEFIVKKAFDEKGIRLEPEIIFCGKSKN